MLDFLTRKKWPPHFHSKVHLVLLGFPHWNLSFKHTLNILFCSASILESDSFIIHLIALGGKGSIIEELKDLTLCERHHEHSKAWRCAGRHS